MPLPIPVILSLSQACASTVSPKTMAAIVQVESGGDPLAIGINSPTPGRLHPRSEAEAVQVATRLLANGADLDLGLGQINRRNLAPLGLSIADAFDPCRNLQGAAKILAADYWRSDPQPGAEQVALRTSLSLYNTGDRQRGLRNGYVARVTAAVGLAARPPAAEAGQDPSPSPPLRPQSWDVFAAPRQTQDGFVLQPQTTGEVH